ncbi:MAG: thiamine pyrophosphate-binding protein [Aigarchaeota archaeon]|nr:thiamine pyrophosphate-binding protein [Candidatus Pelearchaeum maunauluense]
MTLVSGSKLLVDSLRGLGVQHIFALLGSDLVPVFDILRETPEISLVNVRHEQAAGHMADGYARVSLKAGVCMVHNGPGLTNVITGIAAAYRAFSPVVLISGAPTTRELYRDTIQELNQTALTRPIVKWNATITRVERIPEMVRRAFSIALQGRKGPVHLDIPRDMLLDFCDVSNAAVSPNNYDVVDFPRVSPDSDIIVQAARLLLSASNPLIIAGGGVKWSEATKEVIALAEMLTAPIATSYGHIDAVPGDFPLFIGQLGRDGSETAKRIAKEADVILAVGTRLGAFTTFFSQDCFSRDVKIIQVDIEPSEIGRHYRVALGMVGDAKAVLRALIEAVKNVSSGVLVKNTDRLNKIVAMRREEKDKLALTASSDATPIKPQRVFRELREALKRDAIIVLDDGNAVAFGYKLLEFYEPRTFLSPLDLACVGCGYPTALGAKIAKPDKQVAAVCGDGGFIMTLHEIATAVQHGINVAAVVLNNNCWAAEKAYQKHFYGGRYFGCDLLNPCFAEVAEKFGAFGVRVERPGELREALTQALDAEKPSVVEVLVDPEELNPPARGDLMKR